MTNTPERPKAPFRMTPVVFHVLLSLADGEAHAYRVMKEIATRTDGAVKIGPGSLHFTLSKLLEAAMIVEASERPDRDLDDARRKYYRMTEFGRAVLESEVSTLADIVELARAKDLVADGRGV
jgi:DNA-binding PadR family transcriptional regulator